VIELINPVIAAGALLPHPEPMVARAENVSFRLDARRLQRIIEPNHTVEGHGVALCPWSYAGAISSRVPNSRESDDERQSDYASHTQIRPPHILFLLLS
jgi:hypothetical protein